MHTRRRVSKFTCIGTSAPFLSKYWCLYCGRQDMWKVIDSWWNTKTRNTKSHLTEKQKIKRRWVCLAHTYVFNHVFILQFPYQPVVSALHHGLLSLLYAQCCHISQKVRFWADKRCTYFLIVWPRSTGLNCFLLGPHLKHVMCCSMWTIALIYKVDSFELFFLCVGAALCLVERLRPVNK